MRYLTRKTFKNYYKSGARYPYRAVLLFGSIIAASFFNLIGPLYYRKLIDIIAGELPVQSVEAAAVGILLQLLMVYLFAWSFWRISAFSSAFYHARVMADLSNSCFQYLHNHSTSFFNNTFVGSLVRKVGRYVRAFESIVDILTWDLIPMIINVSMITVVLSFRNIWLGVAVVFWVSFYVIVNFFFSRYKLKIDIEKSEHDSKVTGRMADTITNHLNIKFFTGYTREVKGFADTVDAWRKIQLKSWNLDSAFEAIQTLLMIFLEIGLMYLAVKLWIRGVITIGDLVLVQSYLIMVIGRLWNVGRMIRRYYESMADAEEMTEILESEHEIKNAKNATELIVNEGTVIFEKVSFSYQKTRRVLSDISFSIRSGERVALVGPSGAGKSTIVNLLLRNYDVERGAILIDGNRIDRVTLESLRKNISVVSQDSILFHRSLMENIRYGRPDATDEEVIEAAKRARAHEFISEFSEGYDTLVGERGVKLSGGERQRVAIARAILKNAPILLLDEATSSLDSESEYLIQNALTELMKGKTVIVIAHRLSTIMKMDRILVIDDGKVIEEGTHNQLTKTNGSTYKQLWERQVGGFIQ